MQGFRPPLALEIRDLRLVEAIVRHGSLEKAGAALHLTESAVSRRLADLERRSPQRLFTKTGRRLSLTPAGERLHAAAPQVLAAIEAVERTLAIPAPLAPLRLATQCYTVYGWVPRVIAGLAERVPGATLEIVPDATSDPFRALLAGSIDLAICHRTPPNRGLVARALFRDRLVAVCDHDHPWSRRRSVEVGDFADQHLLTYAVPWAASDLARRVFAQVPPPRQVTQIPLTEALLELVAAGHGVALLANWVVASTASRGIVTTVPLAGPTAARQWYGVTRRGEERFPVAAAALVLIAAAGPAT